jgi:hypothetical protein
MDVGGDMLVLILVNLRQQGDGGGLEEHGSHGGLRDIEVSMSSSLHQAWCPRHG